MKGTSSTFFKDTLLVSERASFFLNSFTPKAKIFIDSLGGFSSENLNLSPGLYELSVHQYAGYLQVQSSGVYQIHIEPAESKLPVFKRIPLYIQVLQEPQPAVNAISDSLLSWIDSVQFTQTQKGNAKPLKTDWGAFVQRCKNRLASSDSVITYPVIEALVGMSAIAQSKDPYTYFYQSLSKGFQPKIEAHQLYFQLTYNDFLERCPPVSSKALKQYTEQKQIKKLSNLLDSIHPYPGSNHWLGLFLIYRWSANNQLDPLLASACIDQLKNWSKEPVFQRELQAIQKHILTLYVGGQVPDFYWVSSDKHLTLRDLNTKKYTYLFFISSWCKSCVEELMILNQVQTQYPDLLEVILVSLDEKEDDYIKFKEKYNLDAQIKWAYFKDDFSSLENWEIFSVPQGYLMDTNKKLTHHSILPSQKLEPILKQIQESKKTPIKNKPLSDDRKK